MLVECKGSVLLTPKQTIDGDRSLVPSPAFLVAFPNVDNNANCYFVKVH
jgi:hypothetical protein